MKNKLSVKNFGPIREANFDISPLTIFLGLNDSGKSFSALLIHSFLNPFNESSKLFNSQNLASTSLIHLTENNEDLFNEFKDSLNSYADGKPKLNDDSFRFSIEKFFEMIDEGFGRCYTKLIEDKLKSNWNINLNKLNNIHGDPFNISYNNNEFVNENNRLKLLNFSSDYLKDIGKIKLIDEINSTIIRIEFDEDFICINLNYTLWEKLFEENWDSEELEFSIAHIVYLICVNNLIEKFAQNSYYVPAAGDELLKDMNSYLAGEINSLVTPSTIQKQLITSLLSSEKRLEKGYFYELACNMERELIHGEIKFKSTDLKEELVFFDKDHDLELELELVSSSVRELVPLITYLKYYLKNGDILILEEIENHLHPKNQLILVKYLVEAINQGLNIIMTTHSEYIVEKFNNFIRLGNANEEIFEKLGYGESNILNYENVSIYNFEKEDEYSYIAKSIDINETGFDENSFYEVSNELYDESVDIIDAEK